MRDKAMLAIFCNLVCLFQMRCLSNISILLSSIIKPASIRVRRLFGQLAYVIRPTFDKVCFAVFYGWGWTI